jgi:hypothetical protein
MTAAEALKAIDHLANKTQAMTPADQLEAIREVLKDYHALGFYEHTARAMDVIYGEPS